LGFPFDVKFRMVFSSKRPIEDLGAVGRKILKLKFEEMGCWDVWLDAACHCVGDWLLERGK
jgi:hypothetical protein